MKRATFVAVAALVAITTTAETNRAATENWTRNRIADATNAAITAANAYTDAAIQGVGGLTPNDATNAAEAVVQRDVPSWARQQNPPQSGTDATAVRSIVGQFAATGTVARASSVGDAEQWVDSNGYVWKIGERLADEFNDEIIYNTAVVARWEDDGGDDGDGVGWYMTIEDVGKYFVTTERDAEVLSVTVPYEDCRYLSDEITGDTVFSLTRDMVKYPYIFGKVALTNDIPRTAAQIGATTPEDVTAAIREQSIGGIWDETLQVWWTPRMRNGSLTYEATTNVNLNAEN